MQYKLVRDKEDGEKLSTEDYRYILICTAMAQLNDLLDVDMRYKDEKQRVYEILSDLIELLPCISNSFLTTKTERASLARHAAAQKVAAKRATELGSYFEGKVKEIHDEPEMVQ